MGALLVAVALIILIPNSTRSYAELGVVLPTLTQLAIAASDFAMRLWFVALPLALLSGLIDAVVLAALAARGAQVLFWIWAIAGFLGSGLLALGVFLAVWLPVAPCC